MEAFWLLREVELCSRIWCSAGFFVFGSCYAVAERAFVFGVRIKWEYFGLKAKKIETDFTAVLVHLRKLSKPASKLSIWGISWKVDAREARERRRESGGVVESVCTFASLKHVSLLLEMKKKSASKAYFASSWSCNNVFGVEHILI